jgi:glycerol-3-phosphate dehydrogenase
MDEPDAAPIIAPSQGVHIVLDRSFLPGDSAIMVPRTDDGRVLFAIPWHGRALIGTTDTPVSQPELEPRPFDEEIDFLLAHAARYLTKDPRREGVLSTFAGLRPLIKASESMSTAMVPRDHCVLVSKSGLVTVTGGKWTTYRKMAEDTVNQAALAGELPEQPCTTAHLRLHGWADPSQSMNNNWRVYGSDGPALRKLIEGNPQWNEPLHPRLPYRAVEVIWAVRQEMARTVEDVLARRTRALLLDAQASSVVAARTADLMATELGRDENWKKEQAALFRALAGRYMTLS